MDFLLKVGVGIDEHRGIAAVVLAGLFADGKAGSPELFFLCHDMRGLLFLIFPVCSAMGGGRVSSRGEGG